MTTAPVYSEVVEAEGHLIDSQILNVVFDTVVKHAASFDVLKFDIGRSNDEASSIAMRISAPSQQILGEVLEELVALGCRLADTHDALLRTADRDGCVPDDFYSTTNHKTLVRVGGQWLDVERQRMDAVIVIDGERAVCRKLRDVRIGNRVVCGVGGVRVMPEFQDRDRHGFAFMTNEISSERRVEVGVARIAAMIQDIKASGGRIAVVAGPVVVHTGGAAYFQELIRGGYVDVVLAGNALAVHDVEQAFFGTSLGVDLNTGKAIEGGHRHHMRAINTICRAGGLKQAVEQKVLTSGLMYECVTHNVEFVLAGSIRDDGPLPDTIMDLRVAQDRYADALQDVKLVLALSSMLHGIGVGNMLPSWVKVVCVDINPAVVTKLADRGSSQTIGIVTDVGLFLHRLAQKLKA
ncbi:MAG: TIGR00300 family protein [Acidobacteriaceae bacterium]|jgi:lysine-ketoglutarate reductase/saccharopine dehydrogenase-like protein (TIGR00300 family)|nr:TIGR00300 family protein [Acidobacteriaceae bacterium]